MVATWKQDREKIAEAKEIVMSRHGIDVEKFPGIDTFLSGPTMENRRVMFEMDLATMLDLLDAHLKSYSVMIFEQNKNAMQTLRSGKPPFPFQTGNLQ